MPEIHIDELLERRLSSLIVLRVMLVAAVHSFAGAGGKRVAGGHSPVVPVRLPCGRRRRRLSLGTGPLGVLTAAGRASRARPAPCFVQLTFGRGDPDPAPTLSKGVVL